MSRDLTQSIQICICTFRRAILIETLESLQDMQADLPVAIVVIDNDDTASAKALVTRFAAKSSMPVTYVHCPGANISVARNAALDHARARFLAFLDDDETAGPDWIGRLKEVMNNSGAAVVLGPVQALYDQSAPAWMRRSDVHSTRPVFVKDQIITGYSCNVMIDRENDAFDGLTFDHELGRTGGEDTTYFTQVHKRGGHIAFAPKAIVYEKVTPERARFAWLAKRRYRMGQTHGRLALHETKAAKQVYGALLSCAKITFCAGLALCFVLYPARRNTAVLRGCLHAGTLGAHLRLRTLELYGTNNKGVTP